MSETVLKATKYLELVEIKSKIPQERTIYVRLIGDRSNAGTVNFFWRWRQWVWEPLTGCRHSASCLMDIADFMAFLNKERPTGAKKIE